MAVCRQHRTRLCRLAVLLTALMLPTSTAATAEKEQVRTIDLSIGQWSPAASMREQREYPGGIALQDGRILVVSGHPLGGRSLSSAETYDAASDQWTSVGPLSRARNSGNQATLLQDGRVLLAGGHSQQSVIGGAELFDPTVNRWVETASLLTARDPVAVRLQDGRVLAAGGINWFVDGGRVDADCELYSPSTGQWSKTASMSSPRTGQRMILLADGRVLAVGGQVPGRKLTAMTEIFDPDKQHWDRAEDLPEPRAWFSLVRLTNDRVILAGGYTVTPTRRRYLRSVLAFDAREGRWQSQAPMRTARAGFSMTVLSDRYVLAAGGATAAGRETAAAEILDLRTGEWTELPPMQTERRNHRAARLPDGRVLMIGGSNHGGLQYLRNCEIFRLNQLDDAVD